MELWITIALGGLTIFMAAYGGIVSSKNKKHVIVFAVSGLICFGLVVYQGILNSKSKSDTETKIDSLNTAIKNQTTQIGNLENSIKNKDKKLEELGQKQLNLKQKELELNYAISVDMIYDDAGHQFKIYNRGKTNIRFWGTRLDLNNAMKSISKEARIITPNPNTFYYVFTNELEKDIAKNLGLNGERYLPFELFIENERREKFTISFLLWIVVKDGKITIHTQNTDISKADWAK
jgi:vacuolar-type H+-ATPase subunit I/STV1